MLRASANGLDGGPHVAVGRHQIPAGGQELVGFDASAVIELAGISEDAIVQRLGPDDVAIAFDDGMSAAQLDRFVWVEGGMDSAENYPCAALPAIPPTSYPRRRCRWTPMPTTSPAFIFKVGRPTFIADDRVTKGFGVAASTCATAA